MQEASSANKQTSVVWRSRSVDTARAGKVLDREEALRAGQKSATL